MGALRVVDVIHAPAPSKSLCRMFATPLVCGVIVQYTMGKVIPVCEHSSSVVYL